MFGSSTFFFLNFGYFGYSKPTTILKTQLWRKIHLEICILEAKIGELKFGYLAYKISIILQSLFSF